MSLRTEIFEQPEVLERLLTLHDDEITRLASLVKQSGVRSVFLAARGTSDHAGVYAKYVLGALNGLPVAMAAPSLFSLYQSPPDLTGSLVVGISQSGQSPDIVGVVSEGRRQHALTVAITNDPSSPLAEAAEHVLPLHAGPEEAVAATKTYTAQLVRIASLAAALRGDDQLLRELRRVPQLVSEALSLDERIGRLTQRYRYMTQCVVLGRGYNCATAFEFSLKLKELSYLVAAPYPSADFQHGPMAILSQGFPVFVLAVKGAVLADTLALIRKLVNDHRAELIVLSNDQQALELATTAVPLPENLPEWLSPLVSIIPAQLFCAHLTRAKGYDTEAPRGLQKVTLTL